MGRRQNRRREMTTNDDNDDLAKGIAHLGAVRVRCGLAYEEHPGGGWYVAREDDVALLGSRLARGVPDAYSGWCCDCPPIGTGATLEEATAAAVSS
jgi:hypothetical protein